MLSFFLTFRAPPPHRSLLSLFSSLSSFLLSSFLLPYPVVGVKGLDHAMAVLDGARHLKPVEDEVELFGGDEAATVLVVEIGASPEPENQSNGLEQVMVAAIPTMKYDQEAFSSLEDAHCSICLSEYQEKEILRIMPKCGHSFHLSCIDIWLRKQSTCPVCRLPLKESFGPKHVRSTTFTVARSFDDSENISTPWTLNNSRRIQGSGQPSPSSSPAAIAPIVPSREKRQREKGKRRERRGREGKEREKETETEIDETEKKRRREEEKEKWQWNSGMPEFLRNLVAN